MPRPAEASHAPGAVPETIEYSLQFGLAALSELGVDAAYRQELEDARVLATRALRRWAERPAAPAPGCHNA